MNKKIVILSIILLLSLISRILPIFLVPQEIKNVKSDSLEYNELAKNILAGKGYVYIDENMPFKGVTAFRTPGYPLFLTFVYKLFGIQNYNVVRMCQAILLSFIPLLLFLIAGMFLSEKIALTACIFGLIYKPFIVMDFYGGPIFLLSENLVIFTFLIFVYLFLLSLKKESLLLVFLSGVSIGISALVRPMFGLFIFLAVLIIIISKRISFKKAIQHIAILVISFSIVVLPWFIRNYLVFKKVVFSTQTGKVLYGGNNPNAKGGWCRNIPADMREKTRQMSELESNIFFVKATVDYIRSNMRILPKLMFKKIVVAFQPFYTGYEYNLFYAIFFPFFILSLFAMTKNNPFYLIMISAFIYFLFISLIFFGDPRFRYPFEPLFLIGASFSINQMLKSIHKKAFIVMVSTYIMINIIIYFYWENIWHLIKG
ncbi:MAG: glycosyltransferase family 39 protein [Candidatus Omnitrophica bacterium]|nr:glycosyltransferase family 39 protein [Candidatus Omnitrophota bacterium]